MVSLSIDKQEKSKIRDNKYYIDEIKHLLPLVRKEFESRNIEPHTLLLKLEKIYKKEDDLSVEELALLKKLIGKAYTPLIVGQSWKIIEEGENGFKE